MDRIFSIQIIRLSFILAMAVVIIGCGGKRYHYGVSIYNDCDEDVLLYFGEMLAGEIKTGNQYGDYAIISQDVTLTDKEYDDLVKKIINTYRQDLSPIVAKSKTKRYSFTPQDMVEKGDVSRYGMIYYICSQRKK